VHVDFGDRGEVACVALSHVLLVLRVQIALVDAVVLRANVELVRLVFGEVHAVRVDVLDVP
jgi:hypothetical protein